MSDLVIGDEGYYRGYKQGKADAIEEFYNRLNRNKSYMNKVDNPWYYVEMAYREMKGIV